MSTQKTEKLKIKTEKLKKLKEADGEIRKKRIVPKGTDSLTLQKKNSESENEDGEVDEEVDEDDDNPYDAQ